MVDTSSLATISERGLAVWFEGLFAGWHSPWVISAFVFYVAKSWASGLLVKQMSSLTKQLCSVVTVGLLYFFVMFHVRCAPSVFFCPEELDPTLAMVVNDLCVLVSVLTYTLAQRDQHRMQSFEDEAASHKDSRDS